MTRYSDLTITPQTIETFLSNQQPKKGRKVIWNSYNQGTYVKAIHGPIGSKVHKSN